MGHNKLNGVLNEQQKILFHVTCELSHQLFVITGVCSKDRIAFSTKKKIDFLGEERCTPGLGRKTQNRTVSETKVALKHSQGGRCQKDAGEKWREKS